MRGARDDLRIFSVSGRGESQNLDAVIGKSSQIFQNRRHRRQSRDLGHWQLGHGNSSGMWSIEDLKGTKR